MPSVNHTLLASEKRRRRVRAKLHGTASRPRLTVFRSNQHLYLQVINDDSGQTLATASDLSVVRLAKKSKKKEVSTKTMRGEAIASELVEKLKELKIKALVFDRGAYKYHGRIKIIAEKVRELGIKV